MPQDYFFKTNFFVIWRIFCRWSLSSGSSLINPASNCLLHHTCSTKRNNIRNIRFRQQPYDWCCLPRHVDGISHAVKRSGNSRHNSVAVQAFLEQTFPRKLIGSRDRITCPCHLPDFALSSYFCSTNEMLFHPLAGRVRNISVKFTPTVLKNEWFQKDKA